MLTIPTEEKAKKEAAAKAGGKGPLVSYPATIIHFPQPSKHN